MAVRTCKKRFSRDESKSFYLFDPTCCADNHGLFRAEMAMSLDVIYHLVEDNVYEAYMSALFSAADKLVVIYSSNQALPGYLPHIRHRVFTEWIAQNKPDWNLLGHYSNPFGNDDRADVFSNADFYVYAPPMA
jgi:hypothetical protein